MTDSLQPSLRWLTDLVVSKRLFVGSEGGPLIPTRAVKSRDWDRLLRSSSGLPGGVFHRTRSGVRAGGYVGVVDLGWCQVELLPKGTADLSTFDRRLLLVNLLRASGLVPSPLISQASVMSGRGTLLSVLVDSFAERLHRDLLLGVPRRYEMKDEVTSRVRGRIRFAALARQMPASRQLMPVSHAPLQRNNELTRALRALVGRLGLVAAARSTLETLDHCERMLGGVDQVPISRLPLQRLRLRRPEEQRWTPYLTLLGLLRDGSAPTPVGHGEVEAFGILFSLHDVFERLIRRTFKGLPGTFLDSGVGRPRLLHPIDGGRAVIPMRPDFLFRDEAGAPDLVGDAKWKELSHESTSHGILPQDVYQVATYMASHSIDRGVLLFPEADWMRGDDDDVWYRRYAILGGQGELTVGGVDVVGLADPDRDRRTLAAQKLYSIIMAAKQRSGYAV